MATIKKYWEKSAGYSDQEITGLSDDVSRLYTKCVVNVEGVNKQEPVNLTIKAIHGSEEEILYSDSFTLLEGQKKQIGPFVLNKFCCLSISGKLSGHFYHWSDCKIESILSYDDSQAKTLRIGVFFDGTRNNAYNYKPASLAGGGGPLSFSDLHVTTEQSVIPRSYIWTKKSSYNTPPTNIWKLYESFSEGRLSDNLHQIKTYVEGIGTTRGEDDSLFTMGTGWSVPWFKRTGVVAKTDDAIAQIGTLMAGLKEKFDRVELCVYGFSRGSAAARHFINRVKKSDDALMSIFSTKATGAPEVNFVGLYDTVASILALPGLDVGDSSTGSVDITMDDAVCNDVFHIVAGHELRKNYSVNHITPTFVKELRFPGCHEDIGGGLEAKLQEQLFLTEILYSSHTKVIPTEETDCYKKSNAQLKKLMKHPLWGPIYKISDVEIASTLSREYIAYNYSSAVQLKREQVNSGIDHITFQAMRYYSAKKGIVFTPLPSDRVETIPEDLKPLYQATLAKVDQIFEQGISASLMDALTPELGAKYVHNSFFWDQSPTWWVYDGEGLIDRSTFNLLLVDRPSDGMVRREFDADGEVFKPTAQIEMSEEFTSPCA